MRTTLKSALVAALLCSAGAAHAWGQRGHAVIDRAAINALPDDGPVFLKDYADYIARNATQPDSWRSASEGFSKIAEDPNHGWFAQQFAFMETIPRSRHEFILALYDEQQKLAQTDPEAAARTNPRWTGTLPYAVMESYGHLVACMRQVRTMRATGEDAQPMEQTCAFHVAHLGHYIGDGAQPMHVTWHSDGWRGPNPEGYDTTGKSHGRFESAFVDAIALEAEDIADRLGAPGRQQGDVFDHVLAFVNDSATRVETVFRMDRDGDLATGDNPAAREFVIAHTANGARFLRDLVLRAWSESEGPRPNLPNPNDQGHPQYNPMTGSAPAPMSVDRATIR
ncbi:MAG: nuclease [Sphingomonadales bacterium 32-64-17]|nr:MAG: nuclease [Sphingomonadales bacterium 32-64-17]